MYKAIKFYKPFAKIYMISGYLDDNRVYNALSRASNFSASDSSSEFCRELFAFCALRFSLGGALRGESTAESSKRISRDNVLSNWSRFCRERDRTSCARRSATKERT